MTDNVQILTGTSAGRPAAVLTGPDGTPLRLGIGLRDSTAAPSRLKLAMGGPVRVKDELYTAVFSEFRLEMS